jgi:hypothetical protein
MGNFAAVVLALVSARSLPPARTARRSVRGRRHRRRGGIEITCILDDPPPVHIAPTPSPHPLAVADEALSRLIDKIIAEAERIEPGPATPATPATR